MSECKKNCHNCAYKANIPGDAHIECKFNWKKFEHKPPKANDHGIKMGWYLFPINFDPTWQQEECKAFSIEKDLEMVRQGTPIDLIMEMVKAMV